MIEARNGASVRANSYSAASAFRPLRLGPFFLSGVVVPATGNATAAAAKRLITIGLSVLELQGWRRRRVVMDLTPDDPIFFAEGASASASLKRRPLP